VSRRHERLTSQSGNIEALRIVPIHEVPRSAQMDEACDFLRRHGNNAIQPGRTARAHQSPAPRNGRSRPVALFVSWNVAFRRVQLGPDVVRVGAEPLDERFVDLDLAESRDFVFLLRVVRLSR